MRGLLKAGVVALLVALMSLIGACGQKVDDGTQPTGTPSLPALTIQEDTPNMLLTWVDSHGDTHSALKPSEVPEEGKPLVRVVISDREEGTRDPLYVVDLTKPGGGGFAARAMARREWEGVIAKKREAYLGQFAPKTAVPNPTGGASTAPTTSSAQTAAGFVVVIYGAEWCKPCHQAADYLKSKGVPFVMKDVDEDRTAAAEMSAKLEKAGRRGGAIPVIDVKGQILVGYNRSELDRAVAKASSGTVL
ncbi:MAG: NrdH-redoxin [Polyangiaceae bacterium]|nr:NrdH-redoxin [Polyangiaceae bacterium]